MYRKEKSLSMKGSTSALCHNLSVYTDNDKRTQSYGVVHKSVANIITIAADGANVLMQRQVIVKEPGGHGSTIVMQMKYCEFPERSLMVMACQRGIQIYESDGSVMLYWHSLVNPESNEVSKAYARGICTLQDSMLCIGTDSGTILVFEIPPKGTNILLKESLKEHVLPISCLHSHGLVLASGDDSGCIILWRVEESQLHPYKRIDGLGSPCSGVRLWNELLVATYGSGHIRLFKVISGHMCAEVTAHARWINAIDVVHRNGMVLTVSEDSFAKIWQLKEGDAPEGKYILGSQPPDRQSTLWTNIPLRRLFSDNYLL
ncbi:PREDICTED: WD repeat-containing protein 54-like isoform X2 [Priapulus caudatus]|uniref:WD repeat-containing protein 54-like isoform X2 n=1 Tax=Priapulus caudatus TaxID=37621 RepID=A0ABM1DZK9_PRICU|nr:PREDICTED: WD repeat-containing protein 54-like isoform X2 [Priapulus caudatus]